jgi:fumarate reductase flavoprotein subunit
MRHAGTNSKTVSILVLALFIMALVGGCETSTDSDEPYTLHFIPGAYKGSAVGFNAATPITVEVTFSEDDIENIVIVSHDEGVYDAVRDRFNAHEGQFLDEAMEALIQDKVQATIDLVREAIIREQTLALDAISGATAISTRDGVLKAVEDCVRQAGGDEAAAKLKIAVD